MGLLSSVLGGEKGKNGIGSSAKDNLSGISSFRFEYSAMRATNYTYLIEERDRKIVFVFESYEYRDYGEMQTICDPEIIGDLGELYRKYRIAEWDGYDKYNTKILDGSSFGLKISFRDQQELSAHGSNAFPKNYREFKDELERIVEPLKNKVLEEKHHEKILRGIQGDLTSLIVSFKQQGTSGSDRYKAFIRRSNISRINFEVLVEAPGGEYFSADRDHEYSLSVPDEKIDFDSMKKIIEDLNIIEWDDYGKAAEDIYNTEWFQISFNFDDGVRINASGTGHPEHYDEFRDAFLKWLAEATRKVDIGS